MAIGWNETGGTLPFGPKPVQPHLNWREPLTRGLVFATDYCFANSGGNTNNRFDLTKNAVGAVTAGCGPSQGPFGQQITIPSPNDADIYTTSSVVNGLQRATVEFIAKPNINDFGCFFNKGANTANGNFFNVGWVQGNTYVDVGFSTGGAEWQTTDGSFPYDQFCHCVVTYDGSSTSNVPTIYINGRPRPIQTNAVPAGTRVADSSLLDIGNYDGLGADMYPDFVYLRYWNRILSPQEVRSLAGNPWQIYRQPPLLAAANLAGASYALTAGWGLFVEAGEAATLTCGRVVPLARALFSAAGQPATLKYGRQVAAPWGAFVATGEVADLLRGKGMAAGYGSFAETGRTVSFSLFREIIACCGSIMVGGEPAAFIGGTSVIWSPVRSEPEGWATVTSDAQTWTPQPVSSTSWTVE